MTPSITWQQALAWRMERHLLDRVGRQSVEDVVHRLSGVQAQVASSAELAIRVRQSSSRNGEVARALSEGDLVKTWAMRGTLHLMTPEDAARILPLMAASRFWERPSWVRYFGVTPAQTHALRDAVREALHGKVLTREELAAAVTARKGFEHMGEALLSGWGTLLRPAAWHGDLVFGPSRGTRVTFMRPEDASKHWPGIADPDEAAPDAIYSYLGAYGPATIDNFANWLSRGAVPKKRVRGWFDALGDRVAAVDVEGTRAYVPAPELDAVVATKPSKHVRLLPGFDQWVLGPGTDDGHVTPAARRSAVSKQAGWIAPVVVVGGVVSGTWEQDGNVVRVAWFKEAGKPPTSQLDAEVKRLAKILDRDLGTEVALAA